MEHIVTFLDKVTDSNRLQICIQVKLTIGDT